MSALGAHLGTVQSVTAPLPDRLGLALRYRPRTFRTLTGQHHVSAVLRSAVRSASVPQQLLFSGGSGLGKTTVARICAAAILCDTPLEERTDGDACGHCETCDAITLPGRVHPDVVEFDAASHGGKDEIREIAQRALLSPMRARYKIYIIDEAHGLSGPGGQAFLKLLEEPPPHVIFMLATTDPQKMLSTNRGRCTEFELLRPTEKEIVANLQRVASGEGWDLSDRAAHAVVSATSPALGVRGTLMTLEKLAGPLSRGEDPDDGTLTELLGVAPAAQVGALASAIVSGERAAALDALSSLRGRVSDQMLRTALLEWARSSLTAALSGKPGPYGESSTPELALQRYETLVGTPPGEAWTEVAVVKLASPQLVASPESLAALVEEAKRLVSDLSGVHATTAEMSSRTETLVERLQSATAEATSVGRRLVGVTDAARRAAPAPGTPAPEPPAEQPERPSPAPDSHPDPASTPPRQRRPASESSRPPRRPAPEPRPAPASAPAEPSAEAAAFVENLARRSPRTAAMVRSSRVNVSADGVLISAFPAIAKQLSEAAAVNDLRAAAGALALPVRVVESTQP